MKTQHKNFGDVVIVVLSGNFIANFPTLKKARFQINSLTLWLKPEKLEQTKHKVSRRKEIIKLNHR